MNRISAVFNQPDHAALIAYVTAGYPSVEATLKVVPLLASNGCDMVELGIPFSDPLADGVTIQNASFHALQNGVTTETCLEVAGELRKKVEIPLVFMTYFNPVFSYGLEKFCTACIKSGVDGLIIPDLPPDEGTVLEAITRRESLDLIYLLAPTSTEERVRLVAERSRGFIYLVSIAGVTGARNRLPANLEGFITRVKKVARQPLCVGFGISSPEQAGQVARIADGVIVGSRIVQLMEEDRSLQRVGEFSRELRSAIDSSREA
jgi:tryptophan synthase alpha chain